MTSPQPQFPVWLAPTCCLTTFAALLVVCVGVAFGVPGSWYGITAVAVLAWRVTGPVLGVKPRPILILMPWRRRPPPDPPPPNY